MGVYYLTFATFFPLQVTLPDFFLADQLTSQVSKMAYALYQSTNFPFSFAHQQIRSIDHYFVQVQALRSLEFYICYYGWGDYRRRHNTCKESTVFKTFCFIVAVIPYWSRLLQACTQLTFFYSNDYCCRHLYIPFSSSVPPSPV